MVYSLDSNQFQTNNNRQALQHCIPEKHKPKQNLNSIDLLKQQLIDAAIEGKGENTHKAALPGFLAPWNICINAKPSTTDLVDPFGFGHGPQRSDNGSKTSKTSTCCLNALQHCCPPRLHAIYSILSQPGMVLHVIPLAPLLDAVTHDHSSSLVGWSSCSAVGLSLVHRHLPAHAGVHRDTPP